MGSEDPAPRLFGKTSRSFRTSAPCSYYGPEPYLSTYHWPPCHGHSPQAQPAPWGPGKRSWSQSPELTKQRTWGRFPYQLTPSIQPPADISIPQWSASAPPPADVLAPQSDSTDLPSTVAQPLRQWSYKPLRPHGNTLFLVPSPLKD